MKTMHGDYFNGVEAIYDMIHSGSGKGLEERGLREWETNSCQ
jgi:hypothetical protein